MKTNAAFYRYDSLGCEAESAQKTLRELRPALLDYCEKNGAVVVGRKVYYAERGNLQVMPVTFACDIKDELAQTESPTAHGKIAKQLRFKVGDRVRCVNDEDCGPDLVNGREYTIAEADPLRILGSYRIEGCNYWFGDFRFELAAGDGSVSHQCRHHLCAEKVC